MYLHRSSERAVLEVAEAELLGKHESTLLENQTSGVQALLRNEKFDDLARVFRLYSRLPNGLQTVSRIFKQHVQEQGLAIVRSREAAIAAAGGKESSSDSTFVRALLELHDKAKTVRVIPQIPCRGRCGTVSQLCGELSHVTRCIRVRDDQSTATQMVEQQFNGHSLFQKVLKDAFELFVNKVGFDVVCCLRVNPVWLTRRFLARRRCKASSPTLR